MRSNVSVGLNPSGPNVARLAFDLLFDSGDANLEKLVQVRAENRKKLDALDERLRRILRFFEDAAVELEPAQLAIDEILADRKNALLRNILCRTRPLRRLIGDTGFRNSCRHLRAQLSFAANHFNCIDNHAAHAQRAVGQTAAAAV